MGYKKLSFILPTYGNSNHIKVVFQSPCIMKYTINRIIFWIITVFAFVFLNRCLTLNHDNIIAVGWERNNKFRITITSATTFAFSFKQFYDTFIT